MLFTRADKLPFDARPQMSRIFVEGFYEWLQRYEKDREKLTALFTHMFDLSRFYAAAEGDDIAAMAGYTHKVPPVVLQRKEFARVLGCVRGHFVYCMIKKHMMRNGYPFPVSEHSASVEFVASAEKYRRMGAAQGVLKHLMQDLSYSTYILEVAESNAAAFALYKKLGFTEFKREKAPRQSGADYYIYMRLSL